MTATADQVSLQGNQQSNYRRYRSLFARYLRPQGGKVLRMAMFLLLSIGLQLVNPQVIRYFLDTGEIVELGDFQFDKAMTGF